MGGGVVLRFGAARYCVEMADVAEVVPIPHVTRVPGTPGWLMGVANWRGRVLPIVDLRPLLGAEILPLASSSRLVVVTRHSVEVGLIAEAVPGLVDARPLEALPGTAAASAVRLVRGVLDDEGPVSALDVEVALSLGEELPGSRAAS